MRDLKTTVSSLLVFFLIFLSAHTYSLLSGINNFLISLVFVSVGVSMLYIAYKIGEINHGLSGERVQYRGGMGFWLIVMLFVTPVVINLVAVSVKWFGYEVAHAYISEFRFWGILFIPIMCIASYILIRWLIFRCRRFRERLGIGIIERGTV